MVEYAAKDGEPTVGFAARPATDRASQWMLEPDAASGAVAIRNVGSGRYIVQRDPDWAAVRTGERDGASPGLTLWKQEAADDGWFTLENVQASGSLLNAQFPDDTDVRSNGWPGGKGNPTAHWRAVPLSEIEPVRLAAYTDAQRPTDFLYEQGGELKHGAVSEALGNEAASLWLVEDYDGAKRLRSAASGRYIVRGGASGVSLAAQAAPGDGSTWAFTESDEYDDYVTIGSASGEAAYVAGGADGMAAISGDAASLGSQWQLADPNTLPAGDGPVYLRIQNAWGPDNRFYLYESEDGLLKYGNARTDGRDQWVVHKFEGRKLIENRATGHHVRLGAEYGGRIGLAALTPGEERSGGYVWTIRNAGEGDMLVSSVRDKHPGERPLKYMSIQNLTKYAEYGVINPGWSSPRWRFVPVVPDKQRLFRFRIAGTDDQYLLDVQAGADAAVGTATYGPADAADPASIWYLEDAGAAGVVRLKIRAAAVMRRWRTSRAMRPTTSRRNRRRRSLPSAPTGPASNGRSAPSRIPSTPRSRAAGPGIICSPDRRRTARRRSG